MFCALPRGVRTGCSGSWGGSAAAGVGLASSLSRAAAGLRPEALRPPARSLADGRISIRPKARPAADKPLDGAPRGATRAARYACDKGQVALRGAPSPLAVSTAGKGRKPRARQRRENDGAYPLMTNDRQRKELASEIHHRISELKLRLLGLLDNQLDAMQARPEPSHVSVAVARRRLANILQLWRFCYRARCSRSRCCKGEPNECINTCLFLLPHSILAQILSRKDIRKRVRQRVLNGDDLT